MLTNIGSKLTARHLFRLLVAYGFSLVLVVASVLLLFYKRITGDNPSNYHFYLSFIFASGSIAIYIVELWKNNTVKKELLLCSLRVRDLVDLVDLLLRSADNGKLTTDSDAIREKFNIPKGSDDRS